MLFVLYQQATCVFHRSSTTCCSKLPTICWVNVQAQPTAPIYQIEILPAGEEGPRHLNESTVGRIRGIPFLTVSEFLRAKVKAWALYVDYRL